LKSRQAEQTGRAMKPATRKTATRKTATKTRRFDPRSFLAKVGEGRTIATYGENQIIYSQEDPADAVFFIQKGKVKVSVLSPGGKEAVLAILTDGEFFGEGFLNGHALRMGTVVTVTECTVMRLEKTAMVEALRNSKFSGMFIVHLLNRNTRVEEDLIDHLFNSSEKRLARVLLLLANFGKNDKSELVLAPITQETLAEMVGTTRSRVNSFLNKFRRLGFIEYNGEIRINGPLLNAVLHDRAPSGRKRNHASEKMS
jgi:CRP/FNR family cyclic AMP-dependent transcriptional regulator